MWHSYRNLQLLSCLYRTNPNSLHLFFQALRIILHFGPPKFLLWASCVGDAEFLTVPQILQAVPLIVLGPMGPLEPDFLVVIVRPTT